MKVLIPFLILFLVCHTTINAQNTTTDTISIESQFDNLYRTSSSYQIYKVINKQRYLQLKATVSNALQAEKKENTDLKKRLQSAEKNITGLTAEINSLKTTLQNEQDKQNTVSFLGLKLSKTIANLLLWLLILGLLGGVFFFAFKFKNSHVHTKEAEHNLLFIEQEFEQHKKRAIEREQKVRRELLNEINKHKK